MSLLGSSSVVVTRRGLIVAAEVVPSDEILVLVAGKPAYVKVGTVSVDQRDASAAWLCCATGDIVAGGSTRIVTAVGPLTANQLLEMSETEEIGRMAGEWPLLEVFFDSAPSMVTVTPSWAESIRRLCSVHAHDASHLPLVRVGLPNQSTLRLVETFLTGGPAELELGPTGWSWIRPAQDTGTAASTTTQPPSIDEALQVMLALWQPRDEGTSSLPIEHRDIRHWTIALLGILHRSYRLEYRPRYFPLEVAIRETTTPEHHSPLQVLLPAPTESMVRLTLARAGCYVVANQFLIAT